MTTKEGPQMAEIKCTADKPWDRVKGRSTGAVDRVVDGTISQAALHVCARACELKARADLTDDERQSVDKAVDLLMAVSLSTEARVPLPKLEDDPPVKWSEIHGP